MTSISRAEPDMAQARPAGILSGITVLDLTRVVAGPMCTQMLADMGATVLKIEKPGEGDDTRRMAPFLRDAEGRSTDESATFIANNRGKQSLTIDISQKEGADLVRRLAARSDVMIENYKAGGLRKYGLDEAAIRHVRPDIIYCSLTGFGADGPYAPRPAYDFIMQGMAGLMTTCGAVDGPPTRTGIPLTDIITGLNCAVALLGALIHRMKTGEGQFIDCAMLDAAVAANGHFAIWHLLDGTIPSPQGNSNPIAAPADVFSCADGHLIIAAGNNKQFEALARVLGHPEWTEDPRFSTNASRVANRAALDTLIAGSAGGWPKAKLVCALEAAGIPGGPINDIANVFSDPHVRHRGLEMRLPHGRGMEVPSLRSPLRFSRSPVSYAPPPMLGEHTEHALAHILGLSPDDLAALRGRGVI